MAPFHVQKTALTISGCPLNNAMSMVWQPVRQLRKYCEGDTAAAIVSKLTNASDAVDIKLKKEVCAQI